MKNGQYPVDIIGSERISPQHPTLTFFSEQIPNRPKLYLLPGIVPNVNRTYLKQIEWLQMLNKFNIIGIDYPEQGFDIDNLWESLRQNMDDNEEVSIVASSFGTKVITDLLIRHKTLQEKTKKLILIGPFMYLDRKSALSTLASIKSKVPFEDSLGVDIVLARIARQHFNYDPSYSNGDSATMVRETPLVGLKGRMSYFTTPIALSPNRLNIPDTTIVWWEREPASEEQKRRIEETFINADITKLSGQHGYLQSNSEAVIDLLSENLT